MKLRSVAPDWFSDDPQKTAKCVMFPATKDYDPWYSDADTAEAVQDTEDAKNICRGTYDNRPCPLLSECLEFAMINNERYGVWGGMSPEERFKLRKERKLWQQSQRVGVQNSMAA